MNDQTMSSTQWNPSKAELDAILAEMRPVIDRFCDRDRRLLAAWSKAA